MADGVTSPVLNPKPVSRYDKPYKVGRRQSADKCQKTTNHGGFLELLF